MGGSLAAAGGSSMSPDPAFQIQMADLGHDVYLTNNRGNRLSSGHIQLDPIVDAREYWDFSLDGFAEDVIASAKVMNENAGTGKGYYFGYS